MKRAQATPLAALGMALLASCEGEPPDVSVAPPEHTVVEPAKPGRGIPELAPPPAVDRDALGRLDMEALETDAHSEFWRYFAEHPEFGIDTDQIVLHAPRMLRIPDGVRTVHFDRRFNDIPVILRDDERLWVTFEPSTGIVTEVHNTWLPIRGNGLDEPRIQSGTAVQTALGPSMMTQSQFEDARLAWRRGPGGGLELAWSVTFFSYDDGAGAEVLVDAMTGDVLGVRRWEE